jgi:hypothetical protein
VMVKVQMSRWRCPNRKCERRTFTDQLRKIVCLTLVGPESLNLFIFWATPLVAGRPNG